MLGTLGDPISHGAHNTIIDKLEICDKLNNNSRDNKSRIIIKYEPKVVVDQLPKDVNSVRSSEEEDITAK